MALTKEQEIRREAFVMALQAASAMGTLNSTVVDKREDELFALTDRFYKFLRGQDS